MGSEPSVEISVVVPMHNEQDNVAPMHRELSAVLGPLGRSYEILFVDDGSTDATLERMLELVRADPHFAAVELDGNFGEAGALSAGFGTARGSIIVTLDGDLQNNPADIPAMLGRLEEGWLVVSGWRRDRKEPFWTRRLPSIVANWIIARVSGVPVHDTGCGLKAYRREVVAGKSVPRGFQRFMPAVFGVDGRQVTEYETRDRRREHGSTHYGLSRIFAVLRDLTAIRFINRNPAFYARLMPAACAAGVAALVVALAAPLGAALRWAIGLAGALLALGSALSAWGIHRFSRAQELKAYRIRKVHRHGAADG